MIGARSAIRSRASGSRPLVGLGWRPVPEGGVQPLSVVEDLYVVVDRRSGLGEVLAPPP